MPSTDKYQIEVALSTMSKYCTEIDLGYLNVVRNNALYKDLRNVVQRPPKITHENTEDGKHKLQFWKKDQEAGESQVSGLFNHITFPEKSDKPRHFKSQKNNKTASNSFLNGYPQKKHDNGDPQKKHDNRAPEQTTPIPTPFKMDFLQEQYLLISEALIENNYDDKSTAFDLAITPRQLNKLITTLSNNGYVFSLPPSFKLRNGINTYKKSLKAKIDMYFEMRAQKKKDWKVELHAVAGPMDYKPFKQEKEWKESKKVTPTDDNKAQQQ